MENVFRNQPKYNAEKYKYFSVPCWDFYHQKQKKILKNYILDPDIKLIK